MSSETLEELAKDYSAYLKLDASNGFLLVQDVVDNMLTRLEELTSVLQMIKLKNNDCSVSVSEEIIKFRSEISVLSKKITVLNNVLQNLSNNVDVIEKKVEKAETDFGINNNNKLKSFWWPFLKHNKDSSHSVPLEKDQFESVMNNFESGQE